MLAGLFIALCNLTGLKKQSWRGLYNTLARRYEGSDWTFMNYGYVCSDGATLALDTADEPNRNCIQLYHHVASAVDLTDRIIVEVGSGRGGGASFVKRYLGPARLIGIDLSPNAVELCCRIHRVDGLEFRTGDAEHLPLDNSSVDAVINVESSHCYPSFDAFLAEVWRVLRPGGHFLYADFRDRRALEGWRNSVKRSGLVLLRETDITNNVLAALDRDNAHKQDFIDRAVPRLLHSAFNDFAGMRGTVIFNGFADRSLVYSSFVLQKSG
jgi:ubiquinone/menaquinone biosynthesis C-methylase UbiE